MDERNIEDAIVIVTGANSGIGKETAYELSKRGAIVILACRNLEQGNKAMLDFYQRANDEKISKRLQLDLLRLDLMDLKSIDEFYEAVNRKYGRVDILVNNAGILYTNSVLERVPTQNLLVNELERHLLVNYLAPVLLTIKLINLMKIKKSIYGQSRILDVSSSLAIFGHLHDEANIWMEKNPPGLSFMNGLPYGISKFYLALFTKELSKRIDGSKLVTYSICPGLVDTGMFRSLNWWKKIAASIGLFFVGIPSSKGCDTILNLALTKDTSALENGSFYRYSKKLRCVEKLVNNCQLFGEKLWISTENMLGMKFQL